jgi:putative N6-adenine-specific DNA methylase
MRACLYARSAMRVLLHLAEFDAGSKEALYEGARTVPWTDYLTTKTTLAVEATLKGSQITHSGYAALKVKDAVVDALREALGARPDVDASDPDVGIRLHLDADRAHLSLDLSGEPLHKRGYRAETIDAPLKETLAASVLALGNVARDQPFVDPMCGSGTLAIEQALAARRIAPGLSRAFGFQRWPMYRGQLQSRWDRMKEAARAEALPRAPAPIIARDHHDKALLAARANAEAAGVLADLEFGRQDARTLTPDWSPGTVCTNPPYGERMGGPTLQLSGFYRGLAEAFRAMKGWRVVVLSGSPLFEREMHVRADVSHRLWNGPLEARLLCYTIPAA